MIAGAIQMAMVTNPGKQLHAKFVALGTLSGRTKDEIIAEVGPPSSVSGLPDGKTLLNGKQPGVTWHFGSQAKFAMALLTNTFIKVSKRFCSG